MSERLETGRCFCGRIVGEFSGEPFWVCFDHDDDCRRAVGGPMMLWVGYRPRQVAFVAGQPKTFSRTPGVTRSFCGDCGSSIAYVDEGIADEVHVAIGFFDRPQGFPPAAHAFWSGKLPYLSFDDGLARIETYSRQRDPALGTPDKRG